jgi:peptidoglycan hydrolase-like protein with peptidoglycan-binding domain
MARNPNPTYITDDMWWLWLACLGFIPGVRLGGIYANKPGNHNTVLANLANWPNNYSVRNPIDRRDPKTKARAIDLTMDDTWMRTITRRLLDGAARRDKRMRCVKEFFGTVDGNNVVGRIKDSEDASWRTASSDSSHLWHEHIGIHTPYVDDRDAVEGLASLLSGEAWDAWIARKYGGSTPGLPVSGIPTQTLREGDSGPEVLALQVYLNGVIDAGLVEDGRFGPATTAAVRELQRLADITIDGIYGDDSAAALRRLLEDDMPLTDDEIRRFWAYKNASITNRDAYAHLIESNGVLALKTALAAQTALLKQIASSRSSLTAEQVTAAVAAGVQQAMPPVEELAAAVAAAVDHDLDVEAVAEAMREFYSGALGVGE